MLLFGRRLRRDPRADLHRRRQALRRNRRRPWLRLAFWLRGNRRVGRKGDVEAGGPVIGLEESGPQTTSRTAGATQPHGAPPGPGADRSDRTGWLHAMLRVLLAITASLVLCGSGFLGYRFLRHSHSFAVRAVRISPTVHVPTQKLLERADVALGENLFHLDLGRVQRNLAAEPWLKSVRVRRELPGTVVIDVVEHQPQALVALGPLYLSDPEGLVFKRATPAETPGLPVLTGIGREAYISDRAESQALIREGILAMSLYQGAPRRPPIGEVHVDRFTGITLYTTQGTALRLGRGDQRELAARLQRFDAVWGALQKQERQAQMVFLDNRAHPDHVTARLVEAPATSAPN